MIQSAHSQTFADQPWLRDFLSELGFQRTAPDTFSNGRSSVRVEGTVVYLIPADGGKAWRTEIPKVRPESVCQLLKIMLASPKFQSQAELDRCSARQYRAEEALQILGRSIRENPESQIGVHLRRFVWSLYNGHHTLNLWRMKDALDSRHNAAVTEVFSGWMEGFVSEAALRRTLTDSGEIRPTGGGPPRPTP